MRVATRIPLTLLSILALTVPAHSNPYLPKPGEKPVAVRIATCAVSGGFAHLYTALDYGIIDKYGIRMEHIYIRGSSASLGALAADEIQFLYCAADATIPGLATGVEAKLMAAPLVKLPYVLVTRKEIKRPEDLKGKALGVTRPGDLSARLSSAVLKKFHMTDEVAIRPTHRRQPVRALPGDGRQRSPGNHRYASPRHSSEKRWLYGALSASRSRPAVYL
jgi:ABC-type nitrate/sulfonate/bicarbonate transport system substrate-binding protein